MSACDIVTPLSVLPESIHKAIHINQSLIEISAILLQAFCRSAAVRTLAIAEYEKMPTMNLHILFIIIQIMVVSLLPLLYLCCWIHVKKVGIFSCPMDASELLHNNLICFVKRKIMMLLLCSQLNQYQLNHIIFRTENNVLFTVNSSFNSYLLFAEKATTTVELAPLWPF